MKKMYDFKLSVLMFFLTFGIAGYALFKGTEILSNGVVVEHGLKMMPFLLISFIVFIGSLIIEMRVSKKSK